MAGVAALGSQASPPSQAIQAPHGIKRAADSSLEHEQRLSKRFDLLNLVDDNGTRLYFGVPGSSRRNVPDSPAKPAAKPKKRERIPADDAMLVEDTPHRVYIHDLAAEFSDIESDEDTPVFLPDIEKHLSKIPRHVLLGPAPRGTEDNQLILYNVPSSLSVPEEQDNVRKAIVEARQRIRAKQANPVPEPEPDRMAIGTTNPGTGPREAVQTPAMEEDEDAMDID